MKKTGSAILKAKSRLVLSDNITTYMQPLLVLRIEDTPCVDPLRCLSAHPVATPQGVYPHSLYRPPKASIRNSCDDPLRCLSALPIATPEGVFPHSLCRPSKVSIRCL